MQLQLHVSARIDALLKGVVMRTFCGFYRVLFVLMFVMSVGGMACSDDTEKPGKDVEVEEDVSSEDVGDNTDVSSQDVEDVEDVENAEDVAEDVSGNDVGDKVETGGECPEECVVPGGGALSCSGCEMGWCDLSDFERRGKPTYCTGQCMSDAVCKIYGEEWSCDSSFQLCTRDTP